jgi:hypothetical protein
MNRFNQCINIREGIVESEGSAHEAGHL